MSLTTTNDGPREGEVRRVTDALTSTIDDLFADNESLKAQVESLTYSAGILNNENELLRRELIRNKRQRDHYFQCFTALKAKVGSIAALADEAVKMVEVHAYGEAQPTGNGQARHANGKDPVPQFLIKGSPAHA
jgi:regulator of replication initiation timing